MGQRAPTAEELAEGGSWEEFRERLLEDPEVRDAHEKLQPQYERTSKMIGLRAASGLTQAELAERADVSLATIIRAEGGSGALRWDTVERIVAAAGGEVVFKTRG